MSLNHMREVCSWFDCLILVKAWFFWCYLCVFTSE